MCKKIFMILLFGAALCCLEGAPLKVAAYRFEAAYLNDGSSDPGFTKLTDGKTGVGNLVVWHRPKAPKKLIKLNFKFASPVKIKHVDFHIFRGPRSYGWYSITAQGALNGSPLPLGKKSIKHPYATPDKKSKQEVIRMEIPYETPVTDVEFTLEGSGSYQALSEVVFEGTVVPVKAVKLPPNPHEHLIKKAAGKFQLRKVGEIIVLENRHGLFAIDPKRNGGVVLAYDKVSKHNCIPGEWETGGAFLDRFHSGSAQRDFYLDVKYDCKVVSDTPERKQIVVSGKGKGGIFVNVIVEKLYTLEKDSAVLRTDYTITNLQENVVDLESGYWLFNGLLFPAGGVRLIPGIYGVEKVDPAIKEFYHRELSGAWFGGGSKECGSAFVFPYELFREIYFWGSSPRHGTAECKLGVYPIKAGSSLSFTTFLAPYSHVGFPDKVNRYAAGSFELEKEYKTAPAKIVFRSRILTPGNYTLEISGGIASTDGKVKFRKLKNVSVKGKELLSLSFANPFKKGTAVFKADLLSGNTRLFFVEKQSVFRRSSGVYMLAKEGVIKPDLQARQSKLNLNFNSSKVGSPAFDFARKYAGGTPKVLAVNEKSGGIRDMVEIARRFDMELTTNYINGIWSLSNHFTSLTEKRCINELTQVLRKEFDCMIFSANVWHLFSESLKNAIMAKVEKGTGLILIAPLNYPEVLKKNMVSTYIPPKRKVLMLNHKPPRKFKWKAACASPLISGIPVDHLPPTPIMPYKTANVKNHIMAGNHPLLSEFSYGKGKVFLCAWQVEAPADSKPNGFFLPLNNIAPPSETWKYYEYQISLMGKLIYAASGKSDAMPLGKAAATVKNGKIHAALELEAKKAANITVAWVLRNKFSDTWSVFNQQFPMKAGKNRFTALLPAPAMDGVNFVDVRVFNGDGAVLWWGSAPVGFRSAGRFTKVICDTNKVYKETEKVPCSVTASGKGKTIVELWDNNGNLCEKLSGDKVALSLDKCRTKAAKIIFRRMDGNKELDRALRKILIYGNIPSGTYTVMQGWPSLSRNAHVWNYGLYLSQLKKMGINKAGGAKSYGDFPSAERAFRENDILHGGVYSSMWTGGKFPYKKEEKAKFSLIRRPCLSSPEYKKYLNAPAQRKFGPTYKLGAIDVMGADESNSIVNWDGCFSIHCQREFRNFLKKEYGTLAALNKSWETAFTKWDDVVASTAEEARKMKSFASWLDHRTFNDRNLANALAKLVKNLKAADRRLIYSLSGTQNTNPWNAWDHYLMTPSLESLNSYPGEQTVQQRCFAKGRFTNSPWDGYDKKWEISSYMCLKALMDGSSGVSFYGNFTIDPAYNISPGGERLIRAYSPWTNGTAEAVMRSTFKSSPVAFHYTPASIKADWFIGLDKMRQLGTEGFRLLQQDSFLPYDYVAYGQMEKEGVPARYRVLVLPLSAAMSDKEITAAAEFVRKGGTLVADLMPGYYDQHGAVRKNTSKLYALFGMKKMGKARECLFPLLWKKGRFKIDYADFEASPGSAKAYGTINGKPAFFVNRYGKGKAIYMGCSLASSFGDWDAMRYSPGTVREAKLLHSFWADLLAEQKIFSDVQISGITNAQVACRTIADGMLLAIMRNPRGAAPLPKEMQTAEIKLNKKYHIYDTVNKKYLGYGNEFRYGFQQHTQALFTLLPYKVEKVLCNVKRSGRKVVMEIALEAKGARFSDHTFRVDVFDKGGKKNPSYSTIVHGSGNRGTFEFSLPLNKEKVRSAVVTELFTGVQHAVNF